MLVLSLGLLSALLPAKIAGAMFHFEPISFQTESFTVRASITGCSPHTGTSKPRFSSLGMRMNAGSIAYAHRPTSPGKADDLSDAFGRQLPWYTKCGDSCNSPEACESPCYCQPNSTGGATKKGNSQTQNMWGTCRPQSGLPLLLVLWCYRDPSSSCCMRQHTRWTELLLRTPFNVHRSGCNGGEGESAAWYCVCLHSRPQDTRELNEYHCGAGPTGITGERCTRKRTRAMNVQYNGMLLSIML